MDVNESLIRNIYAKVKDLRFWAGMGEPGKKRVNRLVSEVETLSDILLLDTALKESVPDAVRGAYDNDVTTDDIAKRAFVEAVLEIIPHGQDYPYTVRGLYGQDKNRYTADVEMLSSQQNQDNLHGAVRDVMKSVLGLSWMSRNDGTTVRITIGTADKLKYLFRFMFEMAIHGVGFIRIKPKMSVDFYVTADSSTLTIRHTGAHEPLLHKKIVEHYVDELGCTYRRVVKGCMTTTSVTVFTK